jgi:hypothetical protein
MRPRHAAAAAVGGVALCHLTIAGHSGVLYTTPRFQRAKPRGVNMQNPLDSLWGTVIAGVILTVVLYYVAKILIGG